jgi:RNA polymerase sigma factor (sigma-70 family)
LRRKLGKMKAVQKHFKITLKRLFCGGIDMRGVGNGKRRKRALRHISSQEYDEIYKNVRGLVMAGAIKAAGDNRRIDIEDLAQPTFLKIRRAAELYQPRKGPFKGYILSLIGNSSRLEAKRERRMRRGERSINACRKNEEKNLLLISAVNQRAEDPAEEADKRALMEELRRALKKVLLNKTERRVTELFLKGLAVSEIAEKINKTRMAVYLSFETAVEKLRKEIHYRRWKNGFAKRA